MSQDIDDPHLWYVAFPGPFTNRNPKHGSIPHVMIRDGHQKPEVGKAYLLGNLRRLGRNNAAIAWEIDGLGVDQQGQKPHLTVHYGHDRPMEQYNIA